MLIYYNYLTLNIPPVLTESCNDRLHLFSGLIQKLKSQEQERQRSRQRARRYSRTLSADAPPFYMQDAPAGSGSSDTGEGSGNNEHLPAHRRQLGERLYPRVHSLQPVCHFFWKGRCSNLMAYLHSRTRTQIPVRAQISALKVETVMIGDPSPCHVNIFCIL